MMAAPMRTGVRNRLPGALWPWVSRRPLHSESAEKRTHFGFQTVPEEEKGEKVYRVFESVAQKYDVMNDSMSLGVHRLWKDWLLRLMNPTPGTQLLDVAGGTGDIAFRFINYIRTQREKLIRQELKSQQDLSWPEIAKIYRQEKSGSLMGSHAVICDINKEMLKVGKQKLLKLGYSEGLSWVAGDAEELPFADEKFDIYTIAFGIRNVTHIEQVTFSMRRRFKVNVNFVGHRSLAFLVYCYDVGGVVVMSLHYIDCIKALQEAYRVLKPGGRFLCLEFSHVNNPLLSSLYDLYSFQVIPVLGEVIAGDWKSYQYLVESIRRFPPQEEFKAMIEDAGFFRVNYHNLTSGVVAVHSGFKL